MIINSHLIATPQELGDRVEKLTISNPVYFNNERLGFSNRGVSPTIKLYEELPDGRLKIPRNAPVILEGSEIDVQTVKGQDIQVTSKIELRPDQVPAVEAVMKAGDGILQAGTGKGKSVMACEVIARYGKTTMILVHKEFLMNQFTGHLKNWLGLKDEEIGYCRGNPASWTWEGRKVVIGMLQSIYAHKDELPRGFLEYFGFVVSDECHRVSANTWSQVIALFPAHKRLGLTATPKRADGLETIFQYHLGDIVYKLVGVNMKPKVIRVATKVTLKDLGDVYKGRTTEIHLSKLITELSEHRERNKILLKALIQASKAGRRIIFLTDRRNHAEFMKESFDFNKEALGLKDIETRLYLGGMKESLQREAEQNADILFATFSMAKEGLDIPSLDTLILGTPNSALVTVEQSLGRIARSEEGKKTPMVIDIVDLNIGICNALFNKRMKVYRNMELEVK